jgi:hypothetical protein
LCYGAGIAGLRVFPQTFHLGARGLCIVAGDDACLIAHRLQRLGVVVEELRDEADTLRVFALRRVVLRMSAAEYHDRRCD